MLESILLSMSSSNLHGKRFSLIIVMLGPAGSGKSTLSGSLGSWIKTNTNLRVGYVNLDPAADFLPYKPDVDVRSYVNVFELMRREGLGPNGAIVRAVDLIHSSITRVISEINEIDAEVLIVDTPGQNEVFLFRSSGREVINVIKSLGRTVGVYVGDASLSLDPIESVIAYLMSLIVQLRLNLVTVPVLNKADLITQNNVSESSLHLELKTIKERLSTTYGLISELTSSLLEVIYNYLPPTRVPRISAKDGIGLDILFKYIQETACVCGDLT